MRSLPVFLINLDRSPERLDDFMKAAPVVGKEVERIRAVDGMREVPEHLLAQFDIDHFPLYEGEIGCYASHIKIFELMCARHYDAAIVLEDDALLTEDFLNVCQSAVAAAPAGWDVIHLSNVFKRRPLSMVRIANDHRLVKFFRTPINSTGYVISASGCNKFLKQSTRRYPVDLEFRYPWLRMLNIYGVYPPAVKARQEAPSTIDGSSNTTIRSRRRRPSIASQLAGWLSYYKQFGLASYKARTR